MCSEYNRADPSGGVTTLAGTASAGYADGQGTAAAFSNPRGVVVGANELYVADTGNSLIRLVTTSGSTLVIAVLSI